MIEVLPLAIADVKMIVGKRLHDGRGHFQETFRQDHYRRLVADVSFVQDNESLSSQAGTVRGLHFQRPPAAQAKLVRVVRGAVFDVAVDLRWGSPTFGRHVAAELDQDTPRALFIPRGFAHGFVTLRPDTIVHYRVDAYYAPEHDTGILWNDPALGIAWPAVAAPVASPKDLGLPPLAAVVDTLKELAGRWRET